MSSTTERKLAAIMFTDIAGYTAQMSKDEAKAMELLKDKESILKPLLKEYKGTFVKPIGDGTLTYFESAINAAGCAVRLQERTYDQEDLNIRAGRPIVDGIVAKADLRLTQTLNDVLNKHLEISENRLKGIRYPAARAEYPEALSISVCAPEGLYEDSKFREGLNILGRKGLTYDAWHYHYQNQAFTALARAVPETTLILDHFGTPLGVGPYANYRNEIFIQWKKDIQEMVKCENVVIKLGGLAMSDNGFGWEKNQNHRLQMNLLLLRRSTTFMLLNALVQTAA